MGEGEKERRPSKTLRRIGNILSTAAMCILVLLALALLAVKISGCRLFAIESGSMAPEYPVGSLVLVKPVDFEDIEVGDVISYVLNADLVVVTHRVAAVNEAEGTVTPKGDNNEIEDPEVLYENVIGKVILCIPLLGYAAMFITEHLFISLAVLIFIILLFIFLDFLKRPGRENKNGKSPAG